jgi:hypothetical protein
MAQGRTAGETVVSAGVCVALGAVLLLAACASNSPMKDLDGASPQANMAAMSKATSTSDAADPDVETCSDCAGRGKAPTVKGAAVDESGVQMLKIGVKDGFYTPNEFVVGAGAPVVVVFTGKAKGCLAKPRFNTLGEGGDFTSSGTATVDLGPLKPGTYPLECGMGMTGGTIIVR